jgi:predicted phage terminase large subunit-like protein
MVALGIRAGYVGLGTDLLGVDDPYSSDREAYSPVTRAAAWQWWTDTVVPRLQPSTNVLVTFHRWHTDDLAGHLLAQGGWEVMRYPAIADGEGDDPSGRAIGEALSPRFPLEHLESVRQQIGGMAFASLFQGLPGERMGNIFRRDWWRVWTYATIPDSFDEIIQSWDTAYTDDNPDAAYTVGGVWGRKGANIYLLDLARGQWSSITIEQEFRNLCRKWPTALTKLIECRANGKDLIDKLSKTIGGIIPVQVSIKTSGKESRARVVSPLVEAGNVYLPDTGIYPWVQGYIDELAMFPAGLADQVDMTSQALSRYTGAVEGIRAQEQYRREADPMAGAREAFNRRMVQQGRVKPAGGGYGSGD